MGYSDRKIVFATLMFCMFLLGSALDAVMADHGNQGQQASQASRAHEAQGASQLPSGDKVKNEAGGHKSKSEVGRDDMGGDKTKNRDDMGGDKTKNDVDENKIKSQAGGNNIKINLGFFPRLNRLNQGFIFSPPPVAPSVVTQTPGNDHADYVDPQNKAPVVAPSGVTRAPGNDHADYIEPHNKARAEVGLGPLTWNETLAAYARNYANQRIADCELKHSDTKGAYGENIAQSPGPDELTPGVVVKYWVDEEKPFYDPGTKKCCGGECRHYMQVINPNTNMLGCALVQCKNNLGYFATCNYNW
ncbi:hypothetical protein DCAR_0934099 [Daucus carota subsp. sativus]|uniref:SCP domain-containing protein n=1 Tax=Daucus carota subsp. sativus TaxID=79200 RepID=A0AAF0XWU6_DAUCS|nr:PREDICTED: protein PRY2-like [Daucus carota subsp. sativus]WOH14579.1 hypothetical protein DCAR_0934099 [Daucus carota subsp. sativus]